MAKGTQPLHNARFKENCQTRLLPVPERSGIIWGIAAATRAELAEVVRADPLVKEQIVEKEGLPPSI